MKSRRLPIIVRYSIIFTHVNPIQCTRLIIHIDRLVIHSKREKSTTLVRTTNRCNSEEIASARRVFLFFFG